MEAKELADRSCPSVREDASLVDLIDHFRQNPRTTLPVVDHEGIVTGVISLHDLVRHFLPRYIDLMPSLEFLGESRVLEQHLLAQIMDPTTSRLFLVHDLMVRKATVVQDTDSTFKALVMMIQHNLHHLPVVDKDRRYSGMIDQRRIILEILTALRPHEP